MHVCKRHLIFSRDVITFVCFLYRHFRFLPRRSFVAVARRCAALKKAEAVCGDTTTQLDGGSHLLVWGGKLVYTNIRPTPHNSITVPRVTVSFCLHIAGNFVHTSIMFFCSMWLKALSNIIMR